MDSESLRSRATLREWEFRSSFPVVGRIVAAVRRIFYALSAKWPLRVAMEQQSDFNNRILDLVERHTDQSDQWNERTTNLERQSIEADRTSIQTRHDLAALQIAMNRDRAALSEQVHELQTTLGARILDLGEATEQRLLAGDDETRGLADLVKSALSHIEQLQSDVQALREFDEEILGLLAAVRREQTVRPTNTNAPPNGKAFGPCETSVPPDSGIDYFLFEMRYRGSTTEITRRHERYLQYFRPGGEVLDLGCGRGEFLRLLSQNGIQAKGVDLDADMVEFCRQSGLQVEMADLMRYLEGVEDNSLGGVFLGQVVEHLQPDVLARLISLIYRKLKTDAYLVAETINPMCLLALTTHYLMDVTHVRPVHPEVLRFLLQSAGFSEVEVSYAEPVPEGAKLRRLSDAASLSPAEQEWLPVLNANIDRLNDFLYGNQDYAIVGRKFPWPTRLTSGEARRDQLLTP